MNKKLFTPLFLAASFLVVGCSASEIVGRPSWINDPIVVNPEGESYKDNTLKEIYDAIKKLGDTNSNVLNKVMYDIAQKHVGTLDELNKFSKGGFTHNEMKEFVSTHPIYTPDEYGYVRNGEDVSKQKLETEAQQDANFLSKIVEQQTRIREDICKKLFEEIKGGSYSTKIDKFFEEEYFIEHLYKEMYFDGPIPTTGLVTDAVFFPKEFAESWFSYVNATANKGFLHIFKDDGSFTDYYKNYIERKILPDIYRTLLIETYVREQRYTNLGRSYARKVNMVTVPQNTDPITDNNILQLLIRFTDDNIVEANVFNGDFEPIKNALVGFATTQTEYSTVASQAQKDVYDLVDGVITGTHDNTYFETLKDKASGKEFIWGIRTLEDGKPDPAIDTNALKSTYVYRGTKLYDIVEKYLKTVNVVYTTATPTGTYKDFSFYPKEHMTSDEQSAYNDLTNNGAYTLEKGLEIKEREARLTDMTNDGWFLKTGGITDLGADISEDLFNIATARSIDNRVDMKKTKPDSEDKIRYFGDNTETGGKYVNKRAFLLKDKFSPDESAVAESIVLNDDKNYYIIEVEEAASASKLSIDKGEDSYLGLKATTTLGSSNGDMNAITSKVVEQVANSDTYKKNAEQYYLMISNILFYDQSVYDYFKSQFPDLFK